MKYIPFIYITSLVIVLILLAMFVAGFDDKLGAGELSSVIIDEQSKDIDYTDDNTDEDLIIKSDQENYFNLGGTIIVYFSVFNSSNVDQNVKTAFAFSDGTTKFIKDISVHDGEEIIDVTPAPYLDATTSEMVYPEKVNKTVTKWTSQALNDFTSKAVTRKDIKNTQPEKEVTTLIKANETKFFKAEINFTDFKDKEEWFIEVFGDKGGYGHLDPWVYEQLFNTLNTADLNGQDSWSGSALFGVTTTAAARYDAQGTGSGAKGVRGYLSGGTNVITRAVTVTSDGAVYAAIRSTDNTKNDGFIYLARSGVGEGAFVGFRSDGQITYYDNAWGRHDIGAYSADTWYPVVIEYRSSDGTYRAGAYISGTWTYSGDGWVVPPGAAGNYTDLILGIADGNILTYFDTIGPNDPTVAADSCSCTPGADWYVNSSDNCYLATSCDLDGGDLYLLNTGAGSFNIIDGAELSIGKLESTSTAINVEAGGKINFK